MASNTLSKHTHTYTCSFHAGGAFIMEQKASEYFPRRTHLFFSLSHLTRSIMFH